MTRTVLAAAVMALGTGCGGAYVEAPPWQLADDAPVDTRSTFALRTDGGDALVLRVTATRVTGADVSLEQFCEEGGTAIRGRAFGRPVNVDVNEDRVTGLAGGHPIDLEVSVHGPGLHLEGTVAGAPARFAIGPHAAQGTLGRCSYELARAGSGYEGRRSCGGPSAHTWLRLPTALDGWGDDARATVLALLLSGG
jgi:hypothetical protein